MGTIFLIAILAFGFLIVFQIAKANEYVSVLKGEKKTFEQNNRINGFMMIIFLVLGLIGVYWCNELFRGKILGEAASDHDHRCTTYAFCVVYWCVPVGRSFLEESQE